MKKCCLVLFLFLLIWGCECDIPDDVSVKPRDFPGFLRPPDDAYNVQYHVVEYERAIGKVSSLQYSVDEDFPAQAMIKSIQSELSSAGFFPLKYSLFGGQQKLEVGYLWQHSEPYEPEYVNLEWGEHWINKENNDCIVLVYRYRYKIGKETPSKLFVSAMCFSDQTELTPLVKRYKELYPEEDWRKDTTEIDYGKIGEKWFNSRETKRDQTP